MMGAHRRPASRMLVLDDLALELHQHPIHVPIPDHVKSEEELKKFAISVYNDFMQLGYFSWYHAINEITINSFTVRSNCVYPNIST